MSHDPAREALQAAWQALLNGDTAERDRQCERASKILDAQDKPVPIKLVRQPDGSYKPDLVRQS